MPREPLLLIEDHENGPYEALWERIGTGETHHCGGTITRRETDESWVGSYRLFCDGCEAVVYEYENAGYYLGFFAQRPEMVHFSCWTCCRSSSYTCPLSQVEHTPLASTTPWKGSKKAILRKTCAEEEEAPRPWRLESFDG